MNEHTPWKISDLSDNERSVIEGQGLILMHTIGDIPHRAIAEFACKAANCHDDLLMTLSIIAEEIQRANGLPHFSEEQMTFMVESIKKAAQ